MTSYVVTGANRGLELEFVRQLAAASDKNVVFAIVRNKGNVKKLTALGKQNVHILEADVTDRDALKAAAKRVSEVTGGTLDMLINNAAFIGDGREMFGLSTYPVELEEKMGEDLIKAFNVNVVGVVDTTNIFMPLLRAGKLKKVISISSGAGDSELNMQLEDPHTFPYAISKAALNMAMVKYALEPRNREEGFTFLALTPGAVDTLDSDGDPKRLEEYKKLVASIVERLKKANKNFERLETPERSVKMMLEVIGNVGPKDSGAFLSHFGNKTWL